VQIDDGWCIAFDGLSAYQPLVDDLAFCYSEVKPIVILAIAKNRLYDEYIMNRFFGRYASSE
jgi:hypothetical protein